MGEMEERIARVLADESSGWSSDWPNFVRAARAVLSGMREPTGAMVDAANRNNHPRDIDTWRTMIDAAFKEPA